jgi:small subunit ribosomal protein S8
LNQAIKNKYVLAKVPYNKKGLDIIKILYNMGYINSYYFDGSKICVELKYYQDKAVLNGFFFYDRPGHRKSISISQLRRVYNNKQKIYILSTVNGVCTTLDALKMNIGGIIIAEIR